MTGRVATLLALNALLTIGCGGSGQGISARPTDKLSPTNGQVATTLDGAALLERTCTRCHTLRGLSAYSNYWGEPEWRAMVETMIGYGAVLSMEEIPVLVRYLAINYGTLKEGTRPE